MFYSRRKNCKRVKHDTEENCILFNIQSETLKNGVDDRCSSSGEPGLDAASEDTVVGVPVRVSDPRALTQLHTAASVQRLQPETIFLVVLLKKHMLYVVVLLGNM